MIVINSTVQYFWDYISPTGHKYTSEKKEHLNIKDISQDIDRSVIIFCKAGPEGPVALSPARELA